MTEKVDPWAYHKAALAGTRLKVTSAQAGYFRLKHHKPLQNGSLWEPVGFWWVKHPRTDLQFLRWQRYAEPYASKAWDSYFEDQINDVFARCASYPIPFALYKAVREGAPWPPVYEVELPIEWARQGKLMTVAAAESLLRDKTAVSSTKAAMQELAAAPEPKGSSETVDGEPGIGHNSAAEDNRPRHEKYKELADNAWRDYQKWLKDIGGVIKTQEHADEANAWKNKFITLRTQGEKVRKAEKQPHLDAGKAVDEAFNPTIKSCETRENEVIKAQGVWLAAERKRLAEEQAAEQARLDAERAKAAADAPADAPPPPPAPAARAPEPARSGVVGRRTEVVDQPYMEIVDKEAVFKAYSETTECMLAAIAWAERVRLPPHEPVAGTVLKYREVVKG